MKGRCEGGAEQAFSMYSTPRSLYPRTHGVLAQQVVLGVCLGAVHRSQGAEERPPARQDLRRTRLHQLADGRHHLQGAQHWVLLFSSNLAFFCSFYYMCDIYWTLKYSLLVVSHLVQGAKKHKATSEE